MSLVIPDKDVILRYAIIVNNNLAIILAIGIEISGIRGQRLVIIAIIIRDGGLAAISTAFLPDIIAIIPAIFL